MSSSLARWRYVESEGTRDERLDLLRGMAMAFVIVFHVGGFSLFHLFAMFGVEVVAGAEVFVLMSGIALGRAQRARIARDGWDRAVRHLLLRAGQLYALYVIVTMSAWLLSHLPLPHADVLTVWRGRSTDPAYSMFGDARDLWSVLPGVLLFRYGPWQYGIVGLFVLLAALTPLGLRLLAAGRWWLLLAASWALYALGVTRELRIVEGIFEGGAPFLTWQLFFMHGLVAGYHRARVWAFMHSRAGRVAIVLSFLVGLALVFYAMNTPLVNEVVWRKLPSWASPVVLSTEQFEGLQRTVFGSRQWPLIGRLLSVLTAAVVFTTLLTLFWKPVWRAVGWLFVPMGQQSLLVFTVHVYVIFVIAQLELVQRNAILRNTLVQAGAVLLLWAVAYARARRRRVIPEGVAVPARAPILPTRPDELLRGN